MTEQTERDRDYQTVADAIDPLVRGAMMALAAAREEGRAEERERCAKIADNDDDDGPIGAAGEYVASLPAGQRAWGSKEYEIAAAAARFIATKIRSAE